MGTPSFIFVGMAKDPAFLFYSNDWTGGTMHLSLLEKGAYIELLMLQFNRDKFTVDQARHVLKEFFDSTWPVLCEKFETDGMYYWNHRLRLEKTKRQAFTKSRSENLKGKRHITEHKGSRKAPHMGKHMGNGNGNGIRNRNGIGNEVKVLREIAFPWTTETFMAAWVLWIEYRKERGLRTYKVVGEQSALKRLVKLSGGVEEKAISLIELAIASNWQGFWPEKTQNGKSELTREEKFALDAKGIDWRSVGR